MAKIKVTVVMPVYNTQKYVAEALNSIINQELKDIEIIVINDGSTDNSLKIIQSVAGSDDRIQIHSQENRGLSESRNYGIRMAKGEFIYFMDSDDILSPTALLDCYRKGKENALDFIFFDAKIFGQFTAPTALSYQRTHLFEEKVYRGFDILDKLLQKDAFLSSACLNFIDLEFLRSIKLRFYPRILHEDELFTFLLFLQAKKVSFLPYPYFHRRIRNDSIMTSQISRENVDGYFTVAKELLQFREKEKRELLCSLIDKRLTSMFIGILYKTRSMKIKDRTYVLVNCLSDFRKYTSVKDLCLAFFPISNLIKFNRNLSYNKKK